MTRAPDPRYYVKRLAKWARDAGESTAICELNDPELLFRPWVRSLVQRLYRAHVMRRYGWEKEDFVEECILRLLRQVKKDPELLLKPDMNDRRLAGYLIMIGRNLVADRARRKKGWEFLDGGPHINSEEVECGEAGVPGRQDDRPDLIYDLKAEIEWARKFLPKFARSLRHQPKQLKTFTAILFYCEDEESDVGVSRFWIAYKILGRRDQHLPQKLRAYLRETFPGEKPANISQHVTILKNKLAEFLERDAHFVKTD